MNCSCSKLSGFWGRKKSLILFAKRWEIFFFVAELFNRESKVYAGDKKRVRKWGMWLEQQSMHWPGVGFFF